MVFGYYFYVGLASGLLSFGASFLYARGALLEGKTPNRLTWSVFFFGSLAILVSNIGMGINEKLIKAVFDVAGYMLIIPLLIKFGERFSRLDYVCLVLIGGIGVVSGWIWINHGPFNTLLFNLFIDFCGALPTIVKSARRPNSENKRAWLVTGIGSLVYLFIVRDWTDIQDFVYPLYFALMGGGMLFSLYIVPRFSFLRGRVNVSAESH